MIQSKQGEYGTAGCGQDRKRRGREEIGRAEIMEGEILKKKKNIASQNKAKYIRVEWDEGKERHGRGAIGKAESNKGKSLKKKTQEQI